MPGALDQTSVTHSLRLSRHSNCSKRALGKTGQENLRSGITPQNQRQSCQLLKDSCALFYLVAWVLPPSFCLDWPWASGIRDTALDPVHPLLGTLSILGTEVIHTFAGLELPNQMKRTRDEGQACFMALDKCANKSQWTSPEPLLSFLSPPLPYCLCLFSHFAFLVPRVTVYVNRRTLVEKGDILEEPYFAFCWGLPWLGRESGLAGASGLSHALHECSMDAPWAPQGGLRFIPTKNCLSWPLSISSSKGFSWSHTGSPDSSTWSHSQSKPLEYTCALYEALLG